MSTSANYMQTRWSEVPQFVCLRCGVSAVGEGRGYDRIAGHLHAMHAEVPQFAASEEPEQPSHQPSQPSQPEQPSHQPSQPAQPSQQPGEDDPDEEPDEVEA